VPCLALDRPFWVFEQLEVALSEGIWPRVRVATSRIIHRCHVMSSRLRAITAHYKKRHHRRRAEQDLRSRWSLEPGERIRRRELHERYGGARQGGVSPSRSSPNLFVFTNLHARERQGYYDWWEEDGSFHYTGQGQRGYQTLTGGNLAVLNHVKDGRALRVFQGAGGAIQYVGEFVVDDHQPYSWNLAPSPTGGPVRHVIRFHLRPVDRSTTIGRPSRLRLLTAGSTRLWRSARTRRWWPTAHNFAASGAWRAGNSQVGMAVGAG